MSKTPEDIKKLEEKINKVREKHHKKVAFEDSSENSSSKKGLRIVIEFVSGVFVGSTMGYFLDILFGTKPFLLIFLMFFGAAAGFLNVYRFVKQSEQKEK